SVTANPCPSPNNSMVVTLALLLAVARPSPTDSAQYIVLNHGRLAGEMRVSGAGDSVVVRYRYQDRQRGSRYETVYRSGTNGRLVSIETRSVTPEGTLGSVTQRVDF